MYTYPIDYEAFNMEEIVIIVEFLSLIEDANEKNVNKEKLKAKYQLYRTTVNSIAMEKKIEREFFEVSNISIYKTLKKYEVI